VAPKRTDPQVEVVHARDRAAWRRWLERNNATSPAIRLAIAKKGGAVPAVTYEEAIQEALCFGWIDSTANALDEGRYLLRMGPRNERVIKARLREIALALGIPATQLPAR